MNKLCLNINYLEYLLGLYTPDIEIAQIYPTTLKRRHIGKSRATWLFVQQLVQGNSKENTKSPHYQPFVIGFLSSEPIMRSFHVITSHANHANLLPMIPQWTRAAMITSLLRQNDVVTTFWRDDNAIITSRVRWDPDHGVYIFLAATKQLENTSFCPSVRPSVRLSVCPSVCHTLFTIFLSSYHHKIFRNYYQWQKRCPCKRSRS